MKQLWTCSFLVALLLVTARTYAEPGDELKIQLNAASAVLVDAGTGRILFEKYPDKAIPPASMAKVMTLYLCYDALEEGLVARDDIYVMGKAGSSFSRPRFSSLMLLEEGQELSFLELMKGLAIASGNDAAYGIAEILGPGKTAFVDKMNRKVQSLGLENTIFVDPDGWSKFNRVTARDFARMSKAYIQDYPEALAELHSIPFFVYPLPENMPEGREFKILVPRKKKNTNLLLGRVEGVDGLKTGYIDEAGFNFAATASRDGFRLISVVMGIQEEDYFKGMERRAEESEILLEYGFSRYHRRTLLSPELPGIRVWFSDSSILEPTMSHLPEVFLADDEIPDVYHEIHLPHELFAPLDAGTEIGHVDYYLGETKLETAAIVNPAHIPRGKGYRVLKDRFQIWLRDAIIQFFNPPGSW